MPALWVIGCLKHGLPKVLDGPTAPRSGGSQPDRLLEPSRAGSVHCLPGRPGCRTSPERRQRRNDPLTILFGKPDLVLTGTYGQQEQVALLRRQGLEVLSLGPWSGLDDGREQIRILARRLGHPERGEALIARIDAALERARGIVVPERSILVYERGGWVMAPHSPLGEILVHMGFRLHQEALGLSRGGVARLEAIVMTPPDFMLVDADSSQAVDNGTALFAHPALAGAVPLDRRLALPGRLTICGGPSTPVAIDRLAAEVQAKLR